MYPETFKSFTVATNYLLYRKVTLRFSDIQKLEREEVEYIEGSGYFIHFRQEKTEGVEMMPISEQAYRLLGHRDLKTTQVYARIIDQTKRDAADKIQLELGF